MIKRFDAEATENLLSFDLLVKELDRTVAEYAAGKIASPERLVIPLADGGVMLSMPASAEDMASHKLVNVCPGNVSKGLPTINGEVVAYDAVTGVSLFALDGPTVTGRRTAAITLLAISRLRATPPKRIAIIGTGKQASTHAQAFSAYFPDAELVVAGISREEETRFCARHTSSGVRPFTDRTWSGVDVVVTLTTSKSPVYTEAATKDRLVVGVGAFTPDAAEVDRDTVRASTPIVDDPAGARHEAGDLIQAGVDWAKVISLGDVLEGRASINGPVFFKSVGCAAWDLAACRVARTAIAAGASEQH
ncbi:MAG TPA: bifunctional Delta(1)-pyrroline-2-carboxylate/Delta(1)-piperideine-2-carboxylate reductase [Ensifer sp.]|jgi:1-piperideine-2-carboxylate/1-pyrroline-2-carboxylate reductase [NAD(P)H]|uniref:bifunctional Delta(1)-pyrroline-2-carboxylate/Delta(1)-piperideine-2- carboxylate reductase n=1 Tax=Ensifer sp. TaxID=1872086 RepID=UPI002E0EF1A7|nr:bifunctional Delta(1)-pyrroline-2-carboxylate/Delta(1)-piperideine-2-carboxylate reductase [Ensifer sp.]